MRVPICESTYLWDDLSSNPEVRSHYKIQIKLIYTLKISYLNKPTLLIISLSEIVIENFNKLMIKSEFFLKKGHIII